MARRQRTDPQQPDLFQTRAGELEQFAERFARKLRSAAQRAKKEEDVRAVAVAQLALVARDLNVQIEAQHEYTLLRGQVDSVYGSVFVEYKNPADSAAQLGPQLSSPGTRRVIDQIDRRFADVAAQTGRTGAPMLGIGCDGRYFVFRRFVSGRITAEEPVEVSRWSARRFLWAIFNLGTRGFALTPEFLADDFGSGSNRAREGVSAFSAALQQHQDEPRVRTFFGQWKTLFGEVCGYDLSNPSRELGVLSEKFAHRGDDPIVVLFALHTYYALFMKLLAAHVVTYFQTIGTSPLAEMERAPTSAALQERLRRLEDGDIYAHLGVTNFLEGDLFSGYLSAWTPEIDASARSITARLLEYNPNSLRDNPRQARDLLKKLYQELVPGQVRHDLGEYYTPDWLAEETLDAAGYDGDPQRRVLDPACGSGTFLVLALARINRWLEQNFERAPVPQDVAAAAARNIQGFDLNPLAVLAARTNFLIQFYDLFDYRGRLEVPVYLCDSVLTPAEYGEPAGSELWEKPICVPTSAKMFLVPREVTVERETLGKYCNLLADCARAGSGFTSDDFLSKCRNEGIPVSEAVRDQHRQLFTDVRTLDADRRNGVWARFIKNAFAPVFLCHNPVDLVVGNPPWVNWESLPGRMEADLPEGERSDYRQQIAEVFKRYGLFSLSGSAGRLGGGKKDLSMLFVYACADHYLKVGGTLGFVITQTVFKTRGAGDGFRRLEYDEDTGAKRRRRKCHIKVHSVDDLSDFQPFEAAANRTAIFVCGKSRTPTRYPVPYTVWTKIRRGRIATDVPQHEAHAATARERLGAVPVDTGTPTSPWLTAPKSVLAALRKVMGKSDYAAYAGTCTWLNGMYWVRILREVPGGVLIENLFDVGKIKVERVRCAIEPDLLYPLLRGRNVRRWHAEPSAHIILAQDPQTRAGIAEPEMRRRWPKTYTYLKRFETQLRERSGYRKYFEASAPFYSMYNVGPYTRAPWKVVWREQSTTFQASVVGPCEQRLPILPDHKLMLVPCDARPNEAFYMCAALNSSPAVFAVGSYVVTTSTSTHVLERVAVPRYRSGNPVHRKLSDLSRRAHDATARGRASEIEELEKEIDEVAAKLWGLTPRELTAIQRVLSTPRTPPAFEPPRIRGEPL
ncbi:MAG TPA: N-6 DNA methylase [Phycisphaerae bacterium]|nr:N-6 DNA methylase [Phycisphaerae bacterium]HNU45531.1 N-6 DNA methylase [Phycisphaerae bacterium]